MSIDLSEHVKRINVVVSRILDKHGIIRSYRVPFMNYALKLISVAKKFSGYDRDKTVKAVKTWYENMLLIDQ
jgi:hypothetical protein